MTPDCPSGNLLDVRDLCITFGDRQALKGVSVSVRHGSMVGLIGPNGCGKSTMMKCISGIHKNWTGDISIDGTDTRTLRPSEMARTVATVPAEAGQTFGMTVAEMVMLGRYPYVDTLWWEKPEDERAVLNALETFGLSALRRSRVSLLSSGERQRVLIAKAYVQKPKLMLVDEPTSHLDMRYKLEVMEYLRSMAGTGMTVMVAEHDISLMARYCDTCIIMKQGEVIATGRPAEVIDEDLVRRVYGVESRIGLDADGEVYVLPKRSVKEATL